MNTQEKYIETTLLSMDNLQKLEVPFSLQLSIKNNFNRSAMTSMSASQKWMLAASVIALLGLNIITITQYSKSSKKLDSVEEKNIVFKEYFSNTIE